MKKRDIPPVKVCFSENDINHLKADVESILHSGMLTSWIYTRKFEDEFAKLCHVSHAIAVNSGTSALEIVLRCLGVENGGEVLVPTNTFTATAAAVFFAGGTPVLTDIDPESLCLDAENVRKNVTPETKGIIAVHIGGLICPEIRALKEICEDRGLFLVEDAAHAHGSLIDGQPAGSLGDAGCFSFYPTKVMTTGEGGIITTDDDDVARKARILRDQGKESFNSNRIVELGYNWRMTEISAAIGLLQLKHLTEMVTKRNKVAGHYTRELSRLAEIRPLKASSNIVTNYYKYVAFLDTKIIRDVFKEKLRKQGVRCAGEVYWPPLHLQPIYKKLLHTDKGSFPVAEDVCRRMVCLPIYADMTKGESEYVIERIHDILRS